MGIAKKVAGAAGRAAVKKIQKASRHYCPGSDNHKHNFVSHRHEGEHMVMYCKNPNCGMVKQ